VFVNGDKKWRIYIFTRAGGRLSILFALRVHGRRVLRRSTRGPALDMRILQELIYTMKKRAAMNNKANPETTGDHLSPVAALKQFPLSAATLRLSALMNCSLV
jgi:hypothetical protein